MEFEELTLEMTKFSKIHGLNSTEIGKRCAVRDRIQKSLRNYYPECKVVIYGSTANDYGTKDSDLDLIFFPSADHLNSDFQINKEEKENQNIPTPQDVDSNKISKETLIQMDVTSQLSFIRKVLENEKNYYRILLIRAKVPIVHFNIGHLKISCDISCGSSHVIHNTKLLKFYSKLDERVQSLTMTLRHWAKSLSIILSGILSSYAFTLLVIFFLQNTDPPILPSVTTLQEISGSTNIISEWNVAFCSDIKKVEKNQNAKSSGELLKDFFSFYLNLDFSTSVISVNKGRCLPINELKSDEILNTFQITSLCIQDPFILSRNVSQNVKQKTLTTFRQNLFLALQIIENETNFSVLFDPKEYTKLSHKILYPKLPTKSITCFIYFDSEKTSLPEQREIFQQTWYKNACQAILDLLKFGLLVECEVIDDSVLQGPNQPANSNDNLLISIQCAVFQRTEVNRAKFKEMALNNCDKTQFSNKILQQQYNISNYMIQENPLLSSAEPFFWFYCDCYKSNINYFNDILVCLTPLTDFKISNPFFHFLKSFLTKNVLKVLSEDTDTAK